MTTDFLVVGAGVAGMRAAIELAEAGTVLVVAKDALSESSSEYAQGGIAVALSDDDEVELHEQDTLAAGDGLCNREAVRALVEEGPAAIQELMDWGARFDREGTKLSFAREGAHSRSRVLHAQGDSTGREISRTLYHKAASLPNVTFQSFSAITDLLVEGDVVAGAVVCDESTRSSIPIHAGAVLLATGGLGRAYSETTNPVVATGDGVAVAYRAGAEISDIEFVQFHPTVLHLGNAPRFLLSEALRGEGAVLRNTSGERFMQRYSPMEELAPRDIVSRSIIAEMRRTGEPHMLLDLTHLDAGFVRRRFPRIYETCLHQGLDITRRPAPVTPAAHYAMGGVRTGLEGHTNLQRLYAAGEVACAGVHGANRLASNSLLEGVVYGRRAGAAMRAWAGSRPPDAGRAADASFPLETEGAMQKLAWEYCGITRTGQGLETALRILDGIPQDASLPPDRALYQRRNIHLVVRLIAQCALARRESRGAHYRLDYPDRLPDPPRHSLISPGHGASFFADKSAAQA